MRHAAAFFFAFVGLLVGLPTTCLAEPPKSLAKTPPNSPVNAAAAAMPAPPIGLWMGDLNVSIIFKLRLVIECKETKGKLSATLDSPDQGAYGIPAEEVSSTNGRFTFKIKSLNASYSGELKPDGSYVGEFDQNSAKMPLTLKRISERPKTVRMQDPKKPYPYDEEEVVVENRRDAAHPVKLAGAFTKPKSKGPHPAVVLITGSGPQDRNEEILNHRPFLIIADYLTRRGVAVLRLDDRGVGTSTRGTAKDTSDTYVGDVSAAIDFLRGRSDVNSRKIGLIGHSEGGLIAPMAAVERPGDVAFIVLLAGPGLPGKEILLLQGAAILKASGIGKSQIADNRQVQEKMFQIAAEIGEDSAQAKKMDAALLELSKKLGSPTKELLQNADFRKSQITMVNSAWMRRFIAFDPRPTLSTVTCPILAVWGQKDLQVPPEENKIALEAAVRSGKNTKLKTAILPNLNHLFQTSVTGSPAEYGSLPESFSPTALSVLGPWIDEQIKQ